MIRTREYLESVLRVVDGIFAEDSEVITDERHWHYGGIYWGTITDELRRLGLLYFDGDDWRISGFQALRLYRIDVQTELDAIIKAEYDRKLANDEKIENMKYGKKAYKLSKIAIWLSAIAILVEIARGILDLVL